MAIEQFGSIPEFVDKGDVLSAKQHNAIVGIVKKMLIGHGFIDAGDGVAAIPQRPAMQAKWVIVRSYNAVTKEITVQEIRRIAKDNDQTAEKVGPEFKVYSPPGQDSSNFNKPPVPLPFVNPETLDQSNPATIFVVHLVLKIGGKWYIQWQNLIPPNMVAIDWTDEQAPGSS